MGLSMFCLRGRYALAVLLGLKISELFQILNPL
jgi:hypothetical protein